MSALRAEIENKAHQYGYLLILTGYRGLMLGDKSGNLIQMVTTVEVL